MSDGIYGNYRIAIDFDNTIYKSKFPEVGEPLPYAIKAINAMNKAGFDIILWTCREGQYLEKAKKQLKKDGLKFDAYNNNLEFSIQNYTDSRKLGANWYIEDRDIHIDNINWIVIIGKIMEKTGVDLIKHI